jgi:hypothetical protein
MDSSGVLRVVVLGDTLMGNGKTYRRLERRDPLGARFVRADSLYVYYYSEYDNREVAMFNLRASNGTVDTIRWGGLFTVRVFSGDSLVVFGRRVSARGYSFDGIVQYAATLADGFGIIGATNFGDGIWPYFAHWSLRGCVVRDTMYGTLLTIPPTASYPQTFQLHQNYPNPFNPTTRIEYAIPKTSHVSLKVFDLLGREVVTLVNEVQGSGFKAVEFDADGLASGVYLYRIQAENFVETKKLMVVR